MNFMSISRMYQDLAFDLSLAALLGENIYNFGELLAHPIVSQFSLILFVAKLLMKSATLSSHFAL